MCHENSSKLAGCHENSSKLTPLDLQKQKHSSTLNPRNKNNPGLGTGMLQISQCHEKDVNSYFRYGDYRIHAEYADKLIGYTQNTRSMAVSCCPCWPMLAHVGPSWPMLAQSGQFTRSPLTVLELLINLINGQLPRQLVQQVVAYLYNSSQCLRPLVSFQPRGEGSRRLNPAALQPSS